MAKKQPTKNRSVVYSALLVAAMLVMLGGGAIAALGASSSSSTTEISIFGASIKTTSSGLVLLVVGAAMAATLALKKPAEIELFSPDSTRRPLLDRLLQAVLPVAFGIAAVGVVLLLLSFG